jgi:heme/copper-type cytochrome/quinol oxidase subunit 2
MHLQRRLLWHSLRVHLQQRHNGINFITQAILWIILILLLILLVTWLCCVFFDKKKSKNQEGEALTDKSAEIEIQKDLLK